MTTATRSPLAELLAGLDVDVDTDHGYSPGLDALAEAAFDRTRRYRYALTRTWLEGAEPLVWVMLNPSTADAFVLDPTVRRCVDFTRREGYGGLVVLNLYAYRSTDPRKLREVEPVGELNDAVIRRVLDRTSWPGSVVCAWGANADPGRARHVVDLVRDAGNAPRCLGRTSKGAPRHPLYVAGKTPLEAL